MDESTTAVVLVMHGGIPKDFPKDELARFRRARQRATAGDESAKAQAREIEDTMRQWPRSEDNDAYFAGASQLARALHDEMGIPVLLAFNEFCAPTLEEAVLHATRNLGSTSIRVITPMLTRGGRHSEFDIPQAIERAKRDIADPAVTVAYVWPVPATQTAAFLAACIRGHEAGGSA